MKVAAVGNMNNGMFALTRHLRDRGLDVELFFVSRYEHFHPKADTFDLDDLSFCHQVSWLDESFYGADPKAIRKDLRGYDAVIATGEEAAALALAGVPIDIYLPYGDDVFRYAHLPERFSLREIARAALRHVLGSTALSPQQMRRGTEFAYVRRAICTAQHVVIDSANPGWDGPMLSLPMEGTLHRSPYPFLYPKPYRADWRQADVHWRSPVDDLRSRYGLVVLYHGRHEWTRAGDPNLKNTHHLIEGFAQFVEQYPDVRAALTTLEYGSDVAASKALIAELGIADKVVWFPRMFRKDLMYLASRADLCCGEFDQSVRTCGVIVEALSLGKPMIHYRDDSFYRGPLYPILNAREPTEIAAAITALVEDPATWRERCMEGQQWVDEYVIRRPLDLICELLGRAEHEHGESRITADVG